MNRAVASFCVTLGAVMLSACGGAGGNREDFALETRVSPDKVVSALSQVNWSEMQLALGALPIRYDRYHDGTLGWTIQSSDVNRRPGEPGRIVLTLAPLDGGSSTRIGVAVAVPPVRMVLGRKDKVLSEEKVEHAIRKVLEQLTKNLDSRRDTSYSAGALGGLIAAVAVAANPGLQVRANQLQEDPRALSDLIAAHENGRTDGPIDPSPRATSNGPAPDRAGTWDEGEVDTDFQADPAEDPDR